MFPRRRIVSFTTFLVFLLLAVIVVDGLSGDQYCSSAACFAVTLDDKQKTATVQITTSNTGWVGWGIGTMMAGSDIVVMWLKSDGSTVFLSRRSVSGHSLPSLIANQTALTLNPLPAGGAFMQNNKLTFSFTRPQTLPESNLSVNTTNFIWAVGADHPADNIGASFSKHTSFGTFKLNLSKSLGDSATPAATSTATPTSSKAPSAAPNKDATSKATDSDTSDSSSSLAMSDKLTIAHGVIMFIVWGILIPAAVYLARFGRHIAGWVKVHESIQIYGSGIGTFVGFWLIFYVTNPDNFQDPHQIIGLVMFIGAFLQIILGVLIHFLYNPNRTHRPIRNWMHIFFGFGIFVLGLIQIPLGFAEYGMSSAWFYAYYAYLGVLFVLFVWFSFDKVKRQKAATKRAKELNDQTQP